MTTCSPAVGPTSVFVASGGGRGITAQCVMRMAQTLRCAFILLGRTAAIGPDPSWAEDCRTETELKAAISAQYRAQGRQLVPRQIQADCRALLARREIAHTVQTVNRVGGRALYVQVDITDGPMLRGKLADAVGQMGAITGIVHGAGNLADKRIEDKTDADFELVYGSKITGLQNLLACAPLRVLEHLVLFSSAAGFFGNPGQTDYALANEILNKTAHWLKRRYPACHVLALNWGPWDGGMVTPALKELFARRQIQLIPAEEGVRVLTDALQEPEAGVQSLVGGRLLAPSTAFDATLGTRRIRRRLTLEANPVLRDHVIGGASVLPATFASAWLIESCAQCYPGFYPVSFADFRVLKGIVFDQTLADEYVLELRESAKPQADAANALVCDAQISSAGPSNMTQYHYRARLFLQSAPAPRPTLPFDPAVYRDSPAPLSCYQDGTLFHGPAFQGIRRILELNPHQVVLECEVPQLEERRQGQFQAGQVNPIAADIAFQCMVLWVRQIGGAVGLPVGCQAGELFAPVPFDAPFYVSMRVCTATQTRLLADIDTHDGNGRVYNRIAGAEVAISRQLAPLFRQNQLRAEGQLP